jgi:hypothetical protein
MEEQKTPLEEVKTVSPEKQMVNSSPDKISFSESSPQKKQIIVIPKSSINIGKKNGSLIAAPFSSK